MAAPNVLASAGNNTSAQTSVVISGYTSPSSGALRLSFACIMSSFNQPTVTGGGGTWTLTKGQQQFTTWYLSLWEMSGTPNGSDITISRLVSETWQPTYYILWETPGYGTTLTQAAVSSNGDLTVDLAYGSQASSGTMLQGVVVNQNAGHTIAFTPDSPWTTLAQPTATGYGSLELCYIENDNTITQFGGDWATSVSSMQAAIEANSSASPQYGVVVTVLSDIQ